MKVEICNGYVSCWILKSKMYHTLYLWLREPIRANMTFLTPSIPESILTIKTNNTWVYFV